MSKRLLLTAIVLAAVVFAAATIDAGVPKLISYQGRLADNLGNPVADGTYSIRFFLYDSEIGGSSHWADLINNVQVTDGLFNVFLGQNTSLKDSIFTYDELWLEVMVAGEILAPRTRLVSSPYAHRVASVDSSLGGTITGDVLILSNSIGNAFEVTQSGPGRGGRFSVNDPGNTEPAILGVSFGAVAGQMFNDGGGDALQATTSGSGFGVYATSAFGTGVYGSSGSTSGGAKAVHGVMTSTSPGSLSAGVRGENNGTGGAGIGVYGSHDGGGWGVYGLAPDGRGVYGNSSTGRGVNGFSTSGFGVYGQASSGVGVYGETNSSAPDAIGVHGVLDNTGAGSFSAAVRGENRGTGLTGVGVSGSHDGSGWGVYGIADGTLARGVYGNSAAGIGVYGNSSTGKAGYFSGQVQMTGGSDASSTSLTDGYLVIGNGTSTNIAIDNNEIIARNNGSVALLHLQADGGQVGIGASGLTIPAGFILGVDGRAIMEEIEVQLSQDWPDYVFDDDYDLMSLEDLEEHVTLHRSLPGIPSADEMDGQRVALGAMQTKLLVKVEELTLHMLALNRNLDALAAQNAELRQQLSAMQNPGSGN